MMSVIVSIFFLAKSPHLSITFEPLSIRKDVFRGDVRDSYHHHHHDLCHHEHFTTTIIIRNQIIVIYKNAS